MSRNLELMVPSAKALASAFEVNPPDNAAPMAEVIMTGDLCPIGRAEDLFLSRKAMVVWSGISADLQDSDLRISNLECPLTNHDIPIVKTGPKLSASPACAEQIRAGGFDVLTLANNHIMDMGRQGLIDTIEACSAAGLKTVGAGCDLKEACRPLLIEIRGIRIAILAFAEHEFSIATAGAAGACPLDPIDNYYQLQEAKAQADFVLVVFHGGNEYYSLPRPGMVKTCNFFVDCGANAVVCQHTHVPGGVQIYKDTPIIYSTGNLLFDWPTERPTGWYTGYMVKLGIQPKAVISLKLIPYFQFQNTPGIKHMVGEEKALFLQEIERLSLVIADARQLEQEWRTFCRSQQLDYMCNLFYRSSFERKLFRRFPLLLSRWLTRDRAALVLNLLRCESHREILIEILSREYQ